MTGPVLAVQDLRISFLDRRGRLSPAVTGVSFEIGAGQTLGLVGESGSGKSVTSLALMRLLPAASAIEGAVRLEGRDILQLSDREMRNLRGDRVAMIFQEPLTALNPSYTVGDQLAETLVYHRGMSRRDARREAIDLLRKVRIPAPDVRAGNYPHHLSGGMRQRVMIAMALALRPALLIADEPTTALDVTIQAQVLDLLRELQAETGTAILFISHDLGVIAEICDEVAVLYCGEIVERGPTGEILTRPEHPYTVGLLASLPQETEHMARRLASIPGVAPQASAMMDHGCRFRPRCPFNVDACRVHPEIQTLSAVHASRCHRAPLSRLAS
jgi:peptide/nickel transport system ATP-binding protein